MSLITSNGSSPLNRSINCVVQIESLKLRSKLVPAFNCVQPKDCPLVEIKYQKRIEKSQFASLPASNLASLALLPFATTTISAYRWDLSVCIILIVIMPSPSNEYFVELDLSTKLDCSRAAVVHGKSFALKSLGRIPTLEFTIHSFRIHLLPVLLLLLLLGRCRCERRRGLCGIN